ncbi:MAG: hypothetical protein ACREOQ_19015 [Gemmatimonadales bacterium]
MRRLHLIQRLVPILSLLCAVLSGCGVDAGPDLTSPSDGSSARPQLKADAEQEQVTGSAFLILDGFGNAPERYTFSAVRHHDGSVSGQFELFTAQDGGIRLHGTVTCFGTLRFPDGVPVANVGGVITSSSEPDLVGINVGWTVFDVGEGRGTPDAVSDLFVGTTEDVQEFCTLPFILFVQPNRRGNVQIHL